MSFDLLPDPVFTLDDRARIVGANRAACEALGRSAADLLDLPVDDVYHAADSTLSAVIRSGRTDAGVWTRRGADGAPVADALRVARLNSTPAAGRFYVTARAAPASNPGELSVALLQQILDSAPDLVFVKDLDGRYLFLNAAAAHVKGKPAAEVIGKDDTNFFPIEFASMLQRNDRSIMVGGQPVEFIEKPVVDGMVRTFVSKKAPFRDQSGHVAGIIGISRDVTAARASEQDLRETEARWQFAVDCSGDGIWDWDVQGGEVFYSPTWKSTLGYRDDEIGTDIAEWSDRIHPDDADLCWERIGEHIRGDNDAFVFEHRLRANDERWHQLRCRGRVIERSDDASPLRIIATFSDVTAQRRSEQDARDLAYRLTLANGVSGIGVWECADPTSGAVDWDDRMYEIYGRPSEFDSTLAGWRELLHPDDVASTVGGWMSVITESTQVLVHNSFRILLPDGQVRAVRSRAKIFRDARGAAERVIGVNWIIADQA